MIGCAVTSELDDLRSLSFGLLPSATERLKPQTRLSHLVAYARVRFCPIFLAVRSAFTIFATL